jgi:hypothetical protein
MIRLQIVNKNTLIVHRQRLIGGLRDAGFSG